MKTQSHYNKPQHIIASATQKLSILRSLTVFPWTIFSKEGAVDFFVPTITILNDLLSTEELTTEERRTVSGLLKKYQEEFKNYSSHPNHL